MRLKHFTLEFLSSDISFRKKLYLDILNRWAFSPNQETFSFCPPRALFKIYLDIRLEVSNFLVFGVFVLSFFFRALPNCGVKFFLCSIQISIFIVKFSSWWSTAVSKKYQVYCIRSKSQPRRVSASSCWLRHSHFQQLFPACHLGNKVLKLSRCLKKWREE